MSPSALLSILLTTLAGGVQTPAQDDKPQVAVELVTETVQVAGGEDFELGARFAIPDGWRIGWQNPGALGAATRARVTAPDGFEIVGPYYPAPHAFTLDDGRVTLGYEHEVVLFFRVKPPRTLTPSMRVSFKLNADWDALGAGESECAGRGRAELELPCYPEHAQVGPNVGSLARFRPLLPKPWKQLDKADLTWSVVYENTGEGMGLELVLSVEGAEALDYFPFAIADLECAGQSLAKSDRATLLTVAYQFFPSSKGAPPPDARGVLRVVRDGVESYFDVRASQPQPRARPKR